MRYANLIDPDGDRLLLHGTPKVLFVTVAGEDRALTTGGFTRAQLEELLDAVAPAGSDPRTDEPVDPEGDAAYWRARAEEALAAVSETEGRVTAARERTEGIREELRNADQLILVEQARADRAEKALTEIAQGGALTPDDFQALVQKSELAIAKRVRALDPTGRFQPSALRLADAIYRGIRDSQRPEGAEEIEADMAAWYGENGMPIGGTGDRLADHLAALGYRKTGADS